MPYKHSPTMEISSNDESDVSCEQIQCCSYCSKDKVLVKEKTYCHDCKSNCFRECKRCKRPFHDEKYFTYSETRCNSCHKKYLNEKVKREQRKRKPVEDPVNNKKTSGVEKVEEKSPCEKRKALKIIGFLPVFCLGQKLENHEIQHN